MRHKLNYEYLATKQEISLILRDQIVSIEVLRFRLGEWLWIYSGMVMGVGFQRYFGSRTTSIGCPLNVCSSGGENCGALLKMQQHVAQQLANLPLHIPPHGPDLAAHVIRKTVFSMVQQGQQV